MLSYLLDSVGACACLHTALLTRWAYTVSFMYIFCALYVCLCSPPLAQAGARSIHRREYVLPDGIHHTRGHVRDHMARLKMLQVGGHMSISQQVNCVVTPRF